MQKLLVVNRANYENIFLTLRAEKPHQIQIDSLVGLLGAIAL